ncbi:MAG: hypothetical protein AAF152_13465 [Cyanobacteria bacterium P01_A01_bin.114]
MPREPIVEKAGKLELLRLLGNWPMRFGLICFLVLFLSTEFVQWVTHLAWLGGSIDLSLPLALLGGGGLAIASSYKHAFVTPAQSVPPTPTEAVPAEAFPTEAISTEAFPPEAVPGKTAPTQLADPSEDSSKSSISFKINPPHYL